MVVLSVAIGSLSACSGGETHGAGSAAGAGPPSQSVCDPIGVCGDSEEPACQGCAVAGPCAEAWAACQTDATGACAGLSECYSQCPLEDTGCYDECDAATSPEAVTLLSRLTDCVFCGQCPDSCRVDTSQCPGR